MPPVRTKRQPTSNVIKPLSTAINKERAVTGPKTKGLARNLEILGSVLASEASTQGKDTHLPDVEMTDTEIGGSTLPTKTLALQRD
ncbi:hypothetical protein K3495_g6818 [Podosphaera aphanis]|nr:hypothetical protein K3495_g6818 [Podosphaera aphanis]